MEAFTPPPDPMGVRDPNLDVDQFMAALQADIRRRRALAEAQGLNFGSLSRRSLGAPRGGRFPPALYDALYRASAVQKATRVSLLVTPVSIPLVGGIIQRVRAMVHRLAIFYVNAAAEKQMSFNVEAIGALNQLVDALDHDAPQAALIDEVSELRQRLAALESRLESPGQR